jgi:hypothetical protein
MTFVTLFRKVMTIPVDSKFSSSPISSSFHVNTITYTVEPRLSEIKGGGSDFG